MSASTSRFMGASTLLHIGAIVGVAALSATILRPLPEGTVPITVEIANEKQKSGQMPMGTQLAKPSQPTVKVKAAKSLPHPPAPAKVAKNVLPNKTTKTKAVEIPIAPVAAPKSPHAVVVPPVAAEPPVVVPEEASPAPFSAEEVAKDFDKIDSDIEEKFAEKERKALAALQKAEQKLQAQEQALAKARDREVERERAALELAREKRMAEEARVAALEKEAELTKAKQMAAQQAAAAAEAAAAAKAAAASKQNSSQQMGGNGDMGGGVAGGPMGAPTGIRNVKDLTQMPGNIKPTYANEDRLKRREGKVIIVGYVTKQGTLTGLRIAKSTGHRSLDLRAYQALKSWRFYPGQEGWVAIPFLWSIKGDAELMPVAAYSK